MSYQVHCLTLSAYHREFYASSIPNFWAVRFQRQLSDIFQDRAQESEWVRHEGRPIRGASQRSCKLWDFLLRVFSKPGDVVVDLMSGTGTFLKIAALSGRIGIGIDNDENLPLDFLNNM